MHVSLGLNLVLQSPVANLFIIISVALLGNNDDTPSYSNVSSGENQAVSQEGNYVAVTGLGRKRTLV